MNPEKQAINVFLIAGQATYREGAIYSEFPDHSTFIQHALETPRYIKEHNYDLAVFSGAATKKATIGLSEARSFEHILCDYRKLNDFPVPYTFDEIACDSAENLIMGLIAARLWLRSKGKAEYAIRTIGVSAAFKFKNWRFKQNAKALGILPYFRFYGFTDQTTFVVPSEYRYPSPEGLKAEYFLLRANNAKEYDRKREGRWTRVDVSFSKRLDGLKSHFPKVVTTLTALDAKACEETLNHFRKAFHEEILKNDS